MADGTVEDWQPLLETKTRTASQDDVRPRRTVVPVLTVLAHFDPSRIGETAWLADLGRGRKVEISRREPLFQAPRGGALRPLVEPRLSRRPLWLSPRPEGILVDPRDGGSPVDIDGEPLHGPRVLLERELERGVVLLLSRRVTLFLCTANPVVQRPPRFGLVGESAAMLRLRSDVAAVADLEIPVLLRGESGTGKELVAQAIKTHGPRRDAPFLSLNMAALPPNLAASELFGAAKGAYSGADKARSGYFRRAHGGTLFLDEIGETPPEVQALLLRALENGEVQPLGEERTFRVDVRLVAATDADLEQASRRGAFKAPLLHRLRGYEIVLPPLRARREDLGRLVHHFLNDELERLGRSDQLQNRGPYEPPFVPAPLIAEMAAYDWPGNVRELRNAVRQLCVASRFEQQLQSPAWQESFARARVDSSDAARSSHPDEPNETRPSPSAMRPSPHRDPAEVNDDELLFTLREQRWNLKATAESLGISRASLYVMIEEHPDIRKAVDLRRDDIEAAIEKVGQGIENLVLELGVSKQGLKRRMTQLNM